MKNELTKLKREQNMNQDVKEKELERQKELKKAASYKRIIGMLGLIVMLGFLVYEAVVFGIEEFDNNSSGGMFTFIFAMLLIIIAGLAVVWTVPQKIHDNGRKKADEWEPSPMEEVKAQGWNLNKVLGQMSLNTGVIIWDTLWGCFLAMDVFLVVFLGGNVFAYVVTGIMALILIIGHYLFKKAYKKAKYSNTVLKYTEESCGTIIKKEEFISWLDEEVRNNILYQSKQFALTEQAIIGRLVSEIYFQPVAIPRQLIKEVTFEFSISLNRYGSKYPVGILNCFLHNGKMVKLYLGSSKTACKVLKVLQKYSVCVTENEEITYRY